MAWDGLFADFGLSGLDSLLPDVPVAAPTWDGGRGRALQAAAAPVLAPDRGPAWRPPSGRDARVASRHQPVPPLPAQMSYPTPREDDSKADEEEGVAQRLRRKRRAPARMSDDVGGVDGGGGSDLEEEDDSDLKSGDRKRKSRREKARRDAINRLFAELSVLCDPNKPSKRDRLEILNEAVQEMRRLQEQLGSVVGGGDNSGGGGGGGGGGGAGNGGGQQPASWHRGPGWR